MSEPTGARPRLPLVTVAAVFALGAICFLVAEVVPFRTTVDQAAREWKPRAEFSVLLTPHATDQQISAVRGRLASMPEVQTFTYTNRDAAYREFSRLFVKDPDVVNRVAPADLPTSFRVVAQRAKLMPVLGARISGLDGVQNVVYPPRSVDALARLGGVLRDAVWVMTAVAAVALLWFAAVLWVARRPLVGSNSLAHS